MQAYGASLYSYHAIDRLSLKVIIKLHENSTGIMNKITSHTNSIPVKSAARLLINKN
jgi:hypothetical protein